MKSTILTTALFLSTALGTVVPRAGKKIDYNGFKLVRLALPEASANVQSQIEELAAHVLNPGKLEQLDVVVSPDNVDAINALVADSKVISEDVGAALQEEGEMSAYAVPSETWFTAYQTYNNHLQFLRDLQGSFTGQSEIVTAGSSVQGRVITGIHIWGSGGKGSKPAVLIHGTVHAREWITTMTTEYFVRIFRCICD